MEKTSLLWRSGEHPFTQRCPHHPMLYVWLVWAQYDGPFGFLSDNKESRFLSDYNERWPSRAEEAVDSGEVAKKPEEDFTLQNLSS